MDLKRKIEITVISDVYLGSSHCQAKKLLSYLNSISPKMLILNGNFFDIFQNKKKSLPKSLFKIVKKIIDFVANGTQVVYITADCDDFLRKVEGSSVAHISVVNHLMLRLDGKKALFFNGKSLDAFSKKVKWLHKFGVFDIRTLLYLSRIQNKYQKLFRGKYFELQSKSKNNANNRAHYIDDLEKTATDIAKNNGCDYVICGHTRQPKIVLKEHKKGTVTYLNSGDWIDNFTALEYQFKRWKIYKYDEDKLSSFTHEKSINTPLFKDVIAAITIVAKPEQKQKKSY